MDQHLLEYWLSGGAGNTDPAAALGGAISTAQQTGLQNIAPGTTLSGNQVALLGAWFRGEASNAFVRKVTNTDPELRLRGPGLGASNTTASYAVLNFASGVHAGELRQEDGSGFKHNALYVSADFSALPADEDGAPFVVTTPDHELFNAVAAVSYPAGFVRYRCYYIKNTTGSSITGATASWYAQVSVSSGMAVGFDPAGVNGVAVTIANEFAVPAGVVFASSAAMPVLPTGSFIALWVRQTINAGFSASAAREVGGIGLTDSSVDKFFANFSMLFEFLILQEDLDDTLVLNDDIEDESIYPVEVLNLTDEISASKIMIEDLSDSVSFNDSVLDARFVMEALEEALVMNDVIASSGIFSVALVDEILLVIQLKSGGETYEGWTLNIETDASSRYLWQAFNSFAEFNKRYYGTSDAGLHELVGDDDDGEPVEAFFLTGEADHGESREKRVTRAYVGMRADGGMLLKVVNDDDEIHVYALVSTNNRLQVQRAKLGQGLESVYWQYGLQNADGADFEAESIKVLPIVLTRRFD